MKTMNAQFELFQRECQKWVKFWGLLDWKIYYYHKDIGKNHGSCAASLPGKVCSLSLAVEANEKLSNEDVRLTAFHEVAELLIASLMVVAETRCIGEQETTEAGHDIVRRLENCVYERLKENL